MKQKYLILFSLSGLILSLDQLAKHWARTTLILNEKHPLVFFTNLVYSTNHGFAFGLLERAPSPFQNVLIVGLPAFAVVLIILIFIKLQDNQLMTSLALTTILGGALGNLLDRLRFGYVVDFLEFDFGFFRIPAFNIADLSILVGLLIMFYGTVRPQRQQRT